KLVYRAGLLHDVGKIGIDDEILLKGDQLTHDEWVQLRMHPEFSYRILQAAEMEPVATWTRHHHEHYDGTGYPSQLEGQSIPLGSRIILVADAFEAMTSDRVYRRALGMRQAVEELRGGAGRQFDPQVVQTMVELVEAGVFTQVMQQYGRIVEPSLEAAPEQVVEQPAVPVTSTSEQQQAAAWAQQQIAQQQPPQAA
ncbi:MAG: metal dependent phosphohydrolase, partial [Thermoleophilia bacterium]|nr:metal dependent phosphohydrolase [Thermoleophilia bacterium]